MNGKNRLSALLAVLLALGMAPFGTLVAEEPTEAPLIEDAEEGVASQEEMLEENAETTLELTKDAEEPEESEPTEEFEEPDESGIMLLGDEPTVAGDPLIGTDITTVKAQETMKVMATVDSKKYGIVINLFDYETDDVWDNNPQNTHATGINALGPIHFYGQGGTAMEVGGSNSFTGAAIARQGTVQPNLVDGYPVFYDGTSLKYLFDTNDIDGIKTVYRDVNHLFMETDLDCLYYDSAYNYAYYDSSQGDGGNFKIYGSTYDLGTVNPFERPSATDTMPVGFFPFDDYNPSKDDLQPTDDLNNMNLQGYNHQFGLTMSADFYMPEDGKVEGQDLIFKFSGDDDALVFIDGVLVMDIGGLHHPLAGTINFAKGKVVVDAVYPTWNDQYSHALGTEVDLRTLLPNLYANDGSEHHLDFFYLERGGCYSNLALETNIYQLKMLTKKIVQKEWTDGADQHNNDEVTVELYADGTATGKTAVLNATNQWTHCFEDLQLYNNSGNEIQYTIQEKPVDGYFAEYSEIKVPEDQRVTEELAETTEVKYKTWVKADTIENGGTYALVANDWTDDTNTKYYALTADEATDTSLAGNLIHVVNRELKVEDNTYDCFVPDVTDAQTWTFTQNENGTWNVKNGDNFLSLRGQKIPNGSGNWWDNSQYYYPTQYVLTNNPQWDGTNAYSANLTVDGAENGECRITTNLVWGNSWGSGFYDGATRSLYMNNGSTPAAGEPGWVAHFQAYKQIEVTETEEKYIQVFHPDQLIVTNRKMPILKLPIQKVIAGDKYEKAVTFAFKLSAGSNNAGVETPMPESGKEVVKITGEGSAEFAEIKFEKAGTYNYLITEIDTKEAGYRYDGVHRVAVTVVQDERSGEWSLTYKVDGMDQVDVVFTNTYKKTQKPPVPSTQDL